MGAMMIEVKAGPLRIRLSQEETSNSPEYVDTMMRMASERLMWIQERTFGLDEDAVSKAIEAAANEEENALAGLQTTVDQFEAGLDDGGDDAGGEPVH